MSSSDTPLISPKSSPTSLPNQSDGDTTITLTPTPPKSTPAWTCRLPVELMSIVLEYLVEDKALGTLAGVQSTSRALYSKTTPLLYRHITLNQFQATMLFGLLAQLRPIDFRFIDETDPIDHAKHLIDQHPSSRLRSFFSNIRTLTIEMESYTVGVDNVGKVFGRYHVIRGWLRRIEAPTLWPALKRFDVQFKARPHSEPTVIAGLPSAETEDDVCLISSIAESICPDNMSVTIDDYKYWRSCMFFLRATHVELKGYSSNDRACIAHASTSLTMFNEYWPSTADYYDQLFRNSRALGEVKYVYLVGRSEKATEVLDVISSAVKWLVRRRATYGAKCLDDLKVTIQDDTTAEGEATAVSRIFKYVAE